MAERRFLLVDADVLPEVFVKVLQAKELLASGAVSNISAAAKQAGISRSAFYKYKDAVRPFNDMLHGRIVTFQTRLRDEPGVLSSVLNSFAVSGANILTINQGIPVSGCALVTIGAETSGLHIPVEELLSRTTALRGVLKCEILAG